MQRLLFVVLNILLPVLFMNGQNLIYHDDFSDGVKSWILEAESDSTLIKTENNILEMISPKGLTLWFNN